MKPLLLIGALALLSLAWFTSTSTAPVESGVQEARLFERFRGGFRHRLHRHHNTGGEKARSCNCG